jgi:hypothetical protein
MVSVERSRSDERRAEERRADDVPAPGRRQPGIQLSVPQLVHEAEIRIAPRDIGFSRGFDQTIREP